MKTIEDRIQRLEQRNRISLALLIIAALAFLTFHELEKLRMSPLRMMRSSDGSVSFSSWSDGPFVVTHLVKYADHEGDKAVAPLPQPMVIIDSHGATLTAEEVSKLRWVNILGEPTRAPALTDELNALYSRPQVSGRE